MTQEQKGFAFWLGLLAAWLLAIGMVLSLPFAIAARNVGAVIFSRERVQATLQTRLIETGTLERILIETLFGERGISREDEWYKRATGYLSQPEKEELLGLLIPPGWVEEQIAGLTDSVFTWLESDQPRPELWMDMQPIKAQLLGQSLDQAVEVFVDSWPSCEPEEVEALQRSLERDAEVPPIVCEPPEPMRTQIIELATRALANETEKVPNRIPLLERETLNPDQLMSTKQSLRGLKVFLAWSWLVPVALLGPIMALKIRGFNDLGRWWGLPILFSGAATIFLNIVLRGARAGIIADLISETGPPGSIQFEIIELLLQSAANQALRLMLIHAVILVLIGFIAWLFLTRRAENKESAQQEIKPSALNEERFERASGRSDTDPSPPPVPSLTAEDVDEPDDGPPSGIFG